MYSCFIRVFVVTIIAHHQTIASAFFTFNLLFGLRYALHDFASQITRRIRTCCVTCLKCLCTLFLFIKPGTHFISLLKNIREKRIKIYKVTIFNQRISRMVIGLSNTKVCPDYTMPARRVGIGLYFELSLMFLPNQKSSTRLLY